MDKTPYSITKKEEFIDWNSEIKKVRIRNLDKLEDLSYLSENWVTCACGNQCAAIPRIQSVPFMGRPKDQHLAELGTIFAEIMKNLYFHAADCDSFQDKRVKREFKELKTKALFTIELIERRSTEILSDLDITE